MSKPQFDNSLIFHWQCQAGKVDNVLIIQLPCRMPAAQKSVWGPNYRAKAFHIDL